MAKRLHDPEHRFTDRVDDYVRYRPSYPTEVVRELEVEAGIRAGQTRVVDIGCGTGISSQLFLAQGYSVIGVEPNDEMRKAARQLLSDYPQFQLVDGTAEYTKLPDSSADLAVAAQSFHWFDHNAARKEIRRTLTPTGFVVLLWNERQVEASPFLRAYEEILLRYATDYRQVDHRNVGEERIARFFGSRDYTCRRFSNHQDLDLEALLGRARSSSYVPNRGHPDHGFVMQALRSAFAEHAQNGTVRIEYETMLYFCALSLP